MGKRYFGDFAFNQLPIFILKASLTNQVNDEPGNEKEIAVEIYSNDDKSITEENKEHSKQYMDPIIS